jgi:hypothetical protein
MSWAGRHTPWDGMGLAVKEAAVAAWPAVWAWRRVRGARRAVPAVGSKAWRWALGAAAAATVSILTVVIGSTLALGGHLDADSGTGGAPAAIRAILLLPPLAAAIAVILIGFTVLAWRRGMWTLAARMHYTAVTAAAAAMILWFEHWNVLRWWFVRS